MIKIQTTTAKCSKETAKKKITEPEPELECYGEPVPGIVRSERETNYLAREKYSLDFFCNVFLC